MKQKFRSLPAAVQVAVTAVVVVVLAVVLTVWRHNGSTYLTGFWDNGSQTLVFGRMLQMQQNQTSPGGFMGVYTQDWSDAAVTATCTAAGKDRNFCFKIISS